MMRRIWLHAVVIIGAATTAFAGAEPSCKLADPRAEEAIARKVEALNGHEYCQFRRYDAIDDFDRDGAADFAVTFNVEGPGGGGNHVDSFLYVFFSSQRQDERPAEMPVGERGSFWPDAISSDGKHLVLHVQRWRHGDALCCPSGSGTILFRVKSGHKLVRVKPGA